MSHPESPVYTMAMVYRKLWNISSRWKSLSDTPTTSTSLKEIFWQVKYGKNIKWLSLCEVSLTASITKNYTFIILWTSYLTHCSKTFQYFDELEGRGSFTHTYNFLANIVCGYFKVLPVQ